MDHTSSLVSVKSFLPSLSVHNLICRSLDALVTTVASIYGYMKKPMKTMLELLIHVRSRRLMLFAAGDQARILYIAFTLKTWQAPCGRVHSG